MASGEGQGKIHSAMINIQRAPCLPMICYPVNKFEDKIKTKKTNV